MVVVTVTKVLNGKKNPYINFFKLGEWDKKTPHFNNTV